MKIPWYKQKTFWSAIITIGCGALTGFGVIPVAVGAALMGGFTSLTNIFLRQGVEKTKNE